MASIRSSQLPIPRDWQEFERITLASLKLRYNHNEFVGYGRPGQAQKGVDICGKVNDNIIGAQCKLTYREITKKIIENELCNAQEFYPKLDNFLICTTSPKDAMLQSYVLSLNYDFNVNILFWDDITAEFEKDINIFKDNFPYIFFEKSIEENFINSFRNFIEYIINTDAYNHHISINVINELSILLSNWTMPDLYSNNKLFYDLQIKIICCLREWVNLMSADYMKIIPNTQQHIRIERSLIDNADEISEDMKLVRINIRNYFSEIIKINL